MKFLYGRARSPLENLYDSQYVWSLKAAGSRSVRWVRPPVAGLPTVDQSSLFERDIPMLDVILVAIGLGFFAISVAYVAACDRL